MPKIKEIQLLFTGVLLLFFCGRVFTQNTFSSEDDLKKRANELFSDSKFSEAYPLFSQLLSLYPKDPTYNYKFGTCMLFSTEDKGKAMLYLEFASQKKTVDNDVFYYLGKAYQLNYRFNDAINSYNTFAKSASPKQMEKHQVKREIEMCNNGKKLLKNVTDLNVLDKKELSETDFFRLYDMGEFNGKLIVKPDEFRTQEDKKHGDKTVIYLQQGDGEVYFSSYGDKGKKEKDIFVVRKLSNGEWSKPQTLGYPINTEYDEDYPFLHPNGKILYFCSRGHNSMGGYDVFKSTRTVETDSWTKPVNMDFPINTPDDDFLFISDSQDKIGYFSSNRSSPQGQVTVYKVKLERRPVGISIIKGIVKKENSVSKQMNAKITVTKIDNNTIQGVYNSNEKTGDYLMNLDNGGKFLFAVEAQGFQKLSEVVVIPVQYELKPLKQEIILTKENGKDKLVINNLFDQEIDDNDYAAVLQFIKERSKLEVNTTSEADALPAVTEISEDTTTTVAEISPEPNDRNTIPSNNEMINMAYQDAKEVQRDANELRKNSDKALLLANEKNEEVIQKQKEAELLAPGTNPDDIQKANDMKRETEQLSNEIVVAYNIAKSLDEDAKKKQSEADFSLQYAKDFEGAMKSNSSAEAIEKLIDQKESLEKKMEENQANADAKSRLEKQASDKQQTANDAITKNEELQEEIKNMKDESERLRKEAKATKNSELSKNLERQANESDNNIQQKQKEAELVQTTAVELKTEADNLKAQADLAMGIMDKIKAAPEVSSQDVAAIDKNKLDKYIEDYKSNTKSEELIASNENTNTNDVKTSASGGVQQTIEDVNKNNTAPVKIDYNTNFTNKLAEAESISDEYARADAVAKVYANWSEATTQEHDSLKNAVKKVKSKAEKKDITNKINYLEALAIERTKQAKTSQQKAEIIRQTETLANHAEAKTDSSKINSGSENTTVPTELKTEMTGSVALTSPSEENTTEKKTIPENTTNAVSNNYTEELANTEKISEHLENEEKQVERYINSYDSLNREIEVLGYALDSAKNDDEKNEIQKKINTIKELQDEKRNLAKASLEKAFALNMSLKELSEKKDRKVVDSTGNIDVTTIVASNNFKKNADMYKKNDEELVKYEQLAVNDNSDAIVTAGLLRDDAQALHAKATEEKKRIDSETPGTSLNAANDYEKQALEKQEKAKAIYLKANYYVKNEAVTPSENAVAIEKIENETTTENTALKNSSVAVNTSDVKSTDEYRKFSEMKTVSENLNKQTKEEYEKSDELKQKSDAQMKESQVIIESTTSMTNQEEITRTIEKSNVLEAEAMSNLALSDSLKKIAQNTESSANAKRIEAEVFAQSLDKEKYDNILAASKEEEKATTASEIISSGTTIELKNTSNEITTVEIMNSASTITEVFETKKTPVYSAKKPIPIDEKLPEGIVYKVQVGAFRNPIPQNLFQGITPIMGERTPQGFIRYTAGLFRKFESAGKAKNQVRAMGYKDAFVVAFLNGKRISIEQARTMTNEQADIATNTANVIENQTQQNLTTPLTDVHKNETTQANVIVNDVKSTDVKSVDGLFYTVQIGVFSRKITSAQLFNIQPLNSEITQNGLIRYTTGVYNDADKAILAKDKIVNIGIKDAFITAYSNGKRISVDEAKKMEMEQEGSIVKKESTVESIIGAAVNNNPAEVKQPEETSSLSTSEDAALFVEFTPITNSATSDTGVVYKVQIGVFRNEVPIDIAKKFTRIAKQEIKSATDKDGLTVYSVGSFATIEEAKKVKEMVIQQGITDAFVTAFYNGRKITIGEGAYNKLPQH